MAKNVHWVYEWNARDGFLERVRRISEAELRAWEYRVDSERKFEFRSGSFADTVRVWRTGRPDLREPASMLVGDREESLP